MLRILTITMVAGMLGFAGPTFAASPVVTAAKSSCTCCNCASCQCNTCSCCSCGSACGC